MESYRLKFKGTDKENSRISIDTRNRKHGDVILGNKKDIEAQLNKDWAVEKITSKEDNE